MAVNLDGAFYLARKWLSAMKSKGWGRIVNICSLAMKTGGLTAGTTYTASKGGLAALTLSLARVNCVGIQREQAMLGVTEEASPATSNSRSARFSLGIL